MFYCRAVIVVSVLMSGLLAEADLVKQLASQARIIISESAIERKRISSTVIRSVDPPVLNSIGAVRIGMSADEVVKALGKASESDSPDGLQRWTYNRAGGATLVVGFNVGGRVAYMVTDFGDLTVPKKLRAGMLLEQFEPIYGGLQMRSTTQLSLERRLMKYPVSHLALIVNRRGNRVECLMVYE